MTKEDTLITPFMALFLGPHAEHGKQWMESITEVLTDYIHWRKSYYPEDGYMLSPDDIKAHNDYFHRFNIQLEELKSILKQNFPFHSPRYLGHMLSEQTLPSVVGYLATMLYNPNNVTDEAAPVTVQKEIEFCKRICKMLGYSTNSWAHMCSGGTIANIEALWAARQTQFLPLMIKDICKTQDWDFRIKTPNYELGKSLTPICSLSDRELLHLKPNEALYMLPNLIEYLLALTKLPKAELEQNLTDLLANNQYNIRKFGYATVLSRLQLKPVIFVPQSAHYSLKKAANILGYGEASIRPIPTNEKFRINIDKLETLLDEVAPDEYIVAVIAVFGTTEEGAIDPVHRVKWLRDKLSKKKNMSFWFHVDAAWGGYFATLMDSTYNTKTSIDSSENAFFEMVRHYIEYANVQDSYTITKHGLQRTYEIKWDDQEVFAAMFALSAADSITVDPHKMGYVPYPAGVIAFKNKRVASLLEQHATYIKTGDSTFGKTNDFTIDKVGPYILEGSRPGAAAMSCWFASEVLPLDIHNHGAIIKATALNAKRFAQYLQRHRKYTFYSVDMELQKKGLIDQSSIPFAFELLYNNIDTNIVCFFVRPMKWREDYRERLNKNMLPIMEPDESWTLEEINLLNQYIQSKLTIAPTDNSDSRKVSIYQKFYVAGTLLEKESYSPESISKTLQKFGFDSDEYAKRGLYVMRSTIMNPWYFQSSHVQTNFDYFMEFITELHYTTRKCLHIIPRY